jgi:uncharacterized membrane protein YgcG
MKRSQTICHQSSGASIFSMGGYMLAKNLAIWMGLVLVSVSLAAQPASGYPPKKGAVNDYAGRLEPAQIKELIGLIKDYDRKTTIEFVVVIPASLQGQSAREYAIGIGDSWRIGKAGRNNGVVLLWAPSERAYSLRVADGLSADLTDSDAAQITRQNLLPNFKAEEYYAGLKETILAAMEHLGNKTWDERLQARSRAAELERQAEAQRQMEEARQDEERQRSRQQAILFFLGAGVVVATIVLAGIAVSHARRRKEKLSELAEAGTKIADNLRAAEQNTPEIQRILDQFTKEAPEQDLSALRSELAAQPDRILKIKVDAQCVNFTELESYGEMVRIRTSSEAEADLLESVKQRIAAIKQAKQQSQALMETLSRESFEISQVRDSSRTNDVNRLLLQGRQYYEQARQSSSMSVIDWLVINNLLNSSHSQVQQAVECSMAEPYVAPPSSSDDSGSIFSSSGGGSDSSSFSSGGGGGGFNSGSGSEGSY